VASDPCRSDSAAEFVTALGGVLADVPSTAAWSRVIDTDGDGVTVLGGSWDGAGIERLAHSCARGLPTVALLVGDNPLAAPVEAASLRVFPSGWLTRDDARSSLASPTIAVVLDHTLIPPAAWAFDGPDVVVALAESAAEAAGVADVAVPDAAAAAEAVSRLVRKITAPVVEPLAPAIQDVTERVPFSSGSSYGVADVLGAMVDGGDVFPLRRPRADGLVTGLARIGGRRVAVLATQPGRSPGLAECERLRRFVGVVDAIGLPLAVFLDADGEAWEEDPRMLQAARDALIAQGSSSVRKFVVVTGRAIGVAAGLLGALGMGADIVVAWARGDLAATPPDGPLAAAARAEGASSRVLDAAREALVVDLVDPNETRQMLADLLAFDAGRNA
jgi:hypothetical protein